MATARGPHGERVLHSACDSVRHGSGIRERFGKCDLLHALPQCHPYYPKRNCVSPGIPIVLCVRTALSAHGSRSHGRQTRSLTSGLLASLLVHDSFDA